MNAEIYRYTTPSYVCRYLPGETARMDFRVIPDLPPEQLDQMLSEGWRRMGQHFFRPACPTCTKCVSLRVSVPEFEANKSQRRIARKNKNLRVVVQRPTVSEEHVRLWREYHQFMEGHRGWPESPMSIDAYHESFLTGLFSFSREFLYFDGDRLIGVGLVDETRTALSSIYFYHDPAWRDRALGVYSVLSEIAYARERNLQFVYVGYWIEECCSMAYKAQYRPHQLLHSIPAAGEHPGWRNGL